jgi:MFS family permease
MVLLRIAGSIVGLLAGGLAGMGLAWLAAVLLIRDDSRPEVGSIAFMGLAAIGLAIGNIVGATAGATIMQETLKRRSSFWRALLGAVAGVLAGGLPTVLCLLVSHGFGGWWWWPLLIAFPCATTIAGAVIGTGGKDEQDRHTEVQSHTSRQGEEVFMSGDPDKKQSWQELLEALVALLFGLPGLALFAKAVWSYSHLGPHPEWPLGEMQRPLDVLGAIVGAALFFVGLVVGACVFRLAWRETHANKK